MYRLPGILMCSALLLAACGQKGPLYLPDEAPPASKPFSACDVADADCRQRAAKAPAPTTSSAPESSTAPSASSTESTSP